MPDLIIDFPLGEIQKKFEIIRGDIVEILPEDESIDILRGLSEDAFFEFLGKQGSKEISIEDISAFLNYFVEKVDHSIEPLYKSEVHKVFDYFLGFVSELEELFYWLCYFTNYKDNGGIGLNVDVFDRLIHDNPEIMLFLAKMYKFLISEEWYINFSDSQKIEWRRILSDHIYKRLEYLSHEPTRRISFDDLMP